jgi:hypothetical protein
MLCEPQHNKNLKVRVLGGVTALHLGEAVENFITAEHRTIHDVQFVGGYDSGSLQAFVIYSD